jgi:hypothetical protein
MAIGNNAAILMGLASGIDPADHNRKIRPGHWRRESRWPPATIEGQGKAVRASPVSETSRPVERAPLAAQSRRIETEAVPIRYVAELVGAGMESERAVSGG